MSNVDVVRALLAALDAGDFARVRELVAPDFRTTPVMTGQPMDLGAWLESHQQVERAFPTLRRNPDGFEGEGDEVRVTLHVTAIHDTTVDIPALGIGPLAPTGLELVSPPHLDTFMLRDGLVTSVRSDMPPGGGLRGMIEQIEKAEETA